MPTNHLRFEIVSFGALEGLDDEGDGIRCLVASDAVQGDGGVNIFGVRQGVVGLAMVEAQVGMSRVDAVCDETPVLRSALREGSEM